MTNKAETLTKPDKWCEARIIFIYLGWPFGEIWGHHMFLSGMHPILGMTFMVATMMIALPSAVKVFNWLGTIWGGHVQFTTPMLFAISFVSMFIIGGLSGIFMAATPPYAMVPESSIVLQFLPAPDPQPVSAQLEVLL